MTLDSKMHLVVFDIDGTLTPAASDRGPLKRQGRRAVPLVKRKRLTILDEVLSYPGVPQHWRTTDLDAVPAPFLAIEFRKNDLTLRFFTTLTAFGTPHDLTLQELRIESFFPADEETELSLRRLSKEALPAGAPIPLKAVP